MGLALKQIAESGLRPKQILSNHIIEDREIRAIGRAHIGAHAPAISSSTAHSSASSAIVGSDICVMRG